MGIGYRLATDNISYSTDLFKKNVKVKIGKVLLDTNRQKNLTLTSVTISVHNLSNAVIGSVTVPLGAASDTLVKNVSASIPLSEKFQDNFTVNVDGTMQGAAPGDYVMFHYCKFNNLEYDANWFIGYC